MTRVSSFIQFMLPCMLAAEHLCCFLIRTDDVDCEAGVLGLPPALSASIRHAQSVGIVIRLAVWVGILLMLIYLKVVKRTDWLTIFPAAKAADCVDELLKLGLRQCKAEFM